MKGPFYTDAGAARFLTIVIGLCLVFLCFLIVRAL